MKSTHNILLAYLKGGAWLATMAAGTAVLMALTGGADQPLKNYSQQKLEQISQSVPDQLVRIDASQAALR